MSIEDLETPLRQAFSVRCESTAGTYPDTVTDAGAPILLVERSTSPHCLTDRVAGHG